MQQLWTGLFNQIDAACVNSLSKVTRNPFVEYLSAAMWLQSNDFSVCRTHVIITGKFNYYTLLLYFLNSRDRLQISLLILSEFKRVN